ncbi:MAG: hypothetical protein ACKOC8_11240 [Pirellulales bacterium]
MGDRGRGGVWRGVALPFAIAAVTAVIVPQRGEAAPTIESLPLAATYGDAVHAYFAGDYQRSYEDLSNVIEAGSTDPRVYYFRGLAALKLGRFDESEADFSTGSTREAEGTGSWPIARSLERIQGHDRVKLERHRARARVALVQDNRRRSTLRYLDVERAAPEVQRTRRPRSEAAADTANPFEEVQPAEERAEPMPAEEPTEELAPEREETPAEDVAEQVDQQREEAGAAAEDVPEQVDQQMENEAAAGENAAEQRDQQAEAEPL